jgi:hypothetical protein
LFNDIARELPQNQRIKLTGAAILVSRGMKVLQAAPAAYPYRSAAEGANLRCELVSVVRAASLPAQEQCNDADRIPHAFGIAF